jgi:hypothetical protein
VKSILTIVTLVSTALPVYALEFYVCTDANGIRHISNHAEFFNKDCTIRDDVYLQVIRKQHANLQSRYTQTEMPLETIQPDTRGKNKITERMTELLDHDKALDEMLERQQQRRSDVPFRTHLQTEGFQRLLELQ